MIETILIVHHTHIDFGYTDHMQTAMTKLCGYVDDALDAIEHSSGYDMDAQMRWTQEVSLPLARWWKRASSKKRRRLLEAIAEGRFEVGAMPVNVSCFADEREWTYMLDHVLPAEIVKAARPTMIMQDDINGISRRGVEMAWDRGVRRLWMGPNSYYGMTPAPAPFAFYWELAPGKRVLVWCNSSYNDGTFLFNENWRQGPVPAAHDLRYRAPAAGDLFDSAPENLQKAHRLLTERLGQLTGSASSIAGTDGFTKCKTRTDYPYKTLITSVAGQWRCDNDPPFAPLSDFVSAWNRAGYMPRLKLCTVGQAMQEFERSAGELPVRTGMWTDYWSNGLASSPVEMAHAREARRVLTAACSPQLGRLTANHKKQRDAVLDELMMVGEHTFASWDSAADPHGTNTRGQIAEKRIYTYRALEGAKMLLHERMRAGIQPDMGTVTLFNSTDVEKRIRLRLPTNCLRGDYLSLADECGCYALKRVPGMSNFMRPQSAAEFSEDNVGRSFGDVCSGADSISSYIDLHKAEIRTLHLRTAAAPAAREMKLPEITLDKNGWPVRVAFDSAACTLIDGECGVFRSIRAGGLSPRWTFKDVFDADAQSERQRLYEKLFSETDARYLETECTRDAELLVYTQRFEHPSLRMGRRTLSIDLLSGSAQLEVKIDRLPDFDPEIFYIGFRAPIGDRPPMATLTGGCFRTLEEQMAGTCRDFICIDGWLGYGEDACWNWFARDSSLVCIGKPRPCTRMEGMPEDTRQFWAQVFDNSWDTNFDPNAWGRMIFRFDIDVGQHADPQRYFEENATEPVVMVTTRNA